MFSLCAPRWGRTPSGWQGGCPHPSRFGGIPPSFLTGDTPILPDGGTPPVRTGWGYPPGDRAAERALATRWAVCLLRSRRRTFLLWTSFRSCRTYYGLLLGGLTWQLCSHRNTVRVFLHIYDMSEEIRDLFTHTTFFINNPRLKALFI